MAVAVTVSLVWGGEHEGCEGVVALVGGWGVLVEEVFAAHCVDWGRWVVLSHGVDYVCRVLANLREGMDGDCGRWVRLFFELGS